MNLNQAGENLLGVENREKRKSFDMRANLVILPDIQEEFEDEKDDDINCGLEATYIKEDSEQTSSGNEIEEDSDGVDINVESEQPSSERELEENTEEQHESRLSVQGEANSSEVSPEVEDTSLDVPAVEQEENRDSSSVSEITSQPPEISFETDENLASETAEEIIAFVFEDSAADENIALLFGLEDQKRIPDDDREVIETFIETERNQNLDATPRPLLPMRKFTTSTVLNEDPKAQVLFKEDDVP